MILIIIIHQLKKQQNNTKLCLSTACITQLKKKKNNQSLTCCRSPLGYINCKSVPCGDNVSDSPATLQLLYVLGSTCCTLSTSWDENRSISDPRSTETSVDALTEALMFNQRLTNDLLSRSPNSRAVEGKYICIAINNIN